MAEKEKGKRKDRGGGGREGEGEARRRARDGGWRIASEGCCEGQMEGRRRGFILQFSYFDQDKGPRGRGSFFILNYLSKVSNPLANFT